MLRKKTSKCCKNVKIKGDQIGLKNYTKNAIRKKEERAKKFQVVISKI